MKADIVDRLTINAQWLHRDGFDISANNAIDAKSEIVHLRAKVAELEAALRKVVKAFDVVEIDSEECLDFDECTAMLVPLDAYHGMSEAIATINAVLKEE